MVEKFEMCPLLAMRDDVQSILSYTFFGHHWLLYTVTYMHGCNMGSTVSKFDRFIDGWHGILGCTICLDCLPVGIR